MSISAIDEKVRCVLTAQYSTQGYLELMQEIFYGMKVVAPNQQRKEYSNFSTHIEYYTHIGDYTSPRREKVSILAVCLKGERYVENSRSTQRSYAKKLIQNAGSDAAMIAFYTPEDPRWRISFVRLDYEMRIENGRIKTQENLTPAKRYSYLVGEGEPCHTAVERFRRFINEGSPSELPTLADLEEAFSVEKVTNEFFALYKEKFHQLCDTLSANEDFVIEAQQHNYTVAQFAKKLMGQIVFLYFLQKKGWLGVKAWPDRLSEVEYKRAYYARGAKSRELIPQVYLKTADGSYRVSGAALNALADADEEILAFCVKGQPWGTGPKDFMRRLYKLAESKKVNFYESYLEPLFYEALNVNRGEHGYCAALHCRIPFLSGGLFEPIDGYDWKHNNFAIPNEVFSNAGVKGPLQADGILDIFDRYNFTMSEDEPMEREVAIDPEMLGKVFENLLEIDDRKSKGAFYTPREIVHYMCQESLIAYLTRTTGVSEVAIRDFILYGDLMKDEDTVKAKREGNGGMYISDELFLIDANGQIVVDRLKDIDKALATIRVADPAVGSGAFPLGMLNEIVRARQNITAYMAIPMNSYDRRHMYRNLRSAYALKYETIKNCIFAADLEPSAVDIAQLRLWLSLVIDDEINPNAQNELEGHRNPSPLPNLECNILCGNSLIDELEGFPLINQSQIIGTAAGNQQVNMMTGIFEQLLPELIRAQDDLFRCKSTTEKQQLKDRISDLRDALVRVQLEGASAEVMARYEESRHTASKPYVLWQLDFARVFREKGGFDIVIGNPPYVQLQKAISEDSDIKLGDLYINQGFESFAKTGDIYCLFYEKGYHLLHNNGILSFITSNKWMRAGYGEKLRGFFAKNTNPLILLDFAGQKIFESATVDVNILVCEKSQNAAHTTACIIKENCGSNLSVYVKQNATTMSFINAENWAIMSHVEQSIKQKIEAVGIPLKEWGIRINRGILTGYNDAFIISTEKKDQLIAEDPRSAEIIRPILRGRDIRRYGYDWAGLWMICTFPSRQYDIDDYPAVKQHLLTFGKQRLEQTGKKYIIDGATVSARKKTSNKWFETQDAISYWDDFSQPKIAFAETMRVHRTGGADRFPRFSYVDEGFFHDKTSFIATGPDLMYVLAVMNSSVMNYYIHKNIAVLDTGGFLMQKIYVDMLPIPKASVALHDQIQALAEQVIELRRKNKDTSILENEIDEWVYMIFGFTDDEIAYIRHT